MRTTIPLLLAVCACRDVPPAVAFVPAKAKPDTCATAGDTVRDAWAEAIGPVSSSCEGIGDTVTIEVMPSAELPCPGKAACTVDGVMYLSAELSWHQAPSAAAHEWVHVLAACETGDADAGHERRDLWAGRDPEGVHGDTVEAIAVWTTPHGPCVGDPMGEPLPPL